MSRLAVEIEMYYANELSCAEEEELRRRLRDVGYDIADFAVHYQPPVELYPHDAVQQKAMQILAAVVVSAAIVLALYLIYEWRVL